MPTRRLPHFLPAARGDAQPSCLVAVDCDSSSAEIATAPLTVRERLTRWGGAGWHKDHRGRQHDWSGEGTDAPSFWRAAEWAARHAGVTWVICHGAARVCGLLDLWRMIESGEVEISGYDNKGDCASDQPDHVRSVQRGTAYSGLDPAWRAGGVLPDVRGGVQRGRGSAARRGGNGSGRYGFAVLEDPPTAIGCRLGTAPGRILICDIRNWGIEDWPREQPLLSRAAWLADVMRRLIGLLSRERLGGLQVTTGAQAMYSLRRRHLTHPIQIHTDPQALALEGAAYYGGRCECRRLGVLKGPVYHLDFRSMYGSICAANHLPALLARCGEWVPCPLPGMCLPCVLHFGQVSLATDEPAYPLRHNGLVIYPTGRFVTTLAGPELTDAVQRGRVTAWHSWSTYVGSPCLSAYAGHVLTLLGRARQEGDSALCQALKSLLVSLVGKFGQKGWVWQPGLRVTAPAPWCEWIKKPRDGPPVKRRSLGWQVQEQHVEGWAPNAVPAIVAWITSAGRIKLLEAIRCAGWAEVAYHDTDSLIVSARGFDRLCTAGMVRDGEPGHLRVLARHWYCNIRGIKSYQLDDNNRCSGVPKGDSEPTDVDGLHWYHHWLKTAVRAGLRPEVEKILRRVERAGVYRHGRVRADGRVEPWVIK